MKFSQPFFGPTVYSQIAWKSSVNFLSYSQQTDMVQNSLLLSTCGGGNEM